MPRRRRVLVEGGLYHVYNRFARGEEVFADPEEAMDFVELLRQVKRRDGLTVLAWALLSNHYHLAVRTSATPLSRTMQHLQGRYSRRFNHRWKRTGPLWQSRYKARLIADQGYLEQVLMYVHLNPVRAGLVDDPGDYVFSGHREIIGKVKNPLADVDLALVSFGDTVKKARRHYRDRINAGLDDDTQGRMFRGLRLFPSRDRDLEADEPVFIDELGRSSGLERPRLEADRFLTAACAILGVELERLAGRRRDGETAANRRLVAAVGIERWGQRATRIGSLLDKHPVAVSRWVAQAARERADDLGFEQKMSDLDEQLSQWALAARAAGKLTSRRPPD